MDEQFALERQMFEKAKMKVDEQRRDSLSDLSKIGFSDGQMMLNFEELHNNGLFSEEIFEHGSLKKKCGECAHKETELNHLKEMAINYEHMKNDNQQIIFSLQEKVQKLNERLQNTEDQNKMINSQRNIHQSMNSSNVLVSSKKSSLLKESNYAQELLQKIITKEEESKRLKIKISKLNQELYENQKTYSQRIDLLYTIVGSYRINE